MLSIDRLRVFARRVCTPATMERRIDPTLADWHNEYRDAVHRGQYWRSRWIQVAGVLTTIKVVSLVVCEEGINPLMHPDRQTQSAVLEASAIFAAVVIVTSAVLAWVPFNMMPVPHPIDARELLYLTPQALPISIPVGLIAAVVFGLRGRLSGPTVTFVLALAVACSLASFVTLGWVAPSANQAYRTKILGFEPPKGDRELTLGELAARIEQIRSFDPLAPATRLSVQYHTRWALSCTPLVLCVFSLAMLRRARRTGIILASIALIASGGFAFLLTWTSYLAFRGIVSPPIAAWLPNAVFIGLTGSAILWSVAQSTPDVAGNGRRRL